MTTPASDSWRIVAAGAVALAVAMGIGRFAFTPLLPMMLHDGLLDLAGASWLASANYLGYLVGALLCTVQPWQWRGPGGRPWATTQPTLLVRAGLAATCVLTLSMALNLPGAWSTLRFVAGVVSAFVFVHGSGWCAAQLAQRGRSSHAALIFVGPGTGIVASGLLAGGMLAWHWPAWAGWLVFGLLAIALTVAIWPLFRTPEADRAAASSHAPSATHTPSQHGHAEIASLTLAYGLAGFGYIVTATFLPVIARQALPGSPWLDLFWPIFGTGVITGALLASRPIFSGDMRLLLAGCYLMQAAGIAAGLVFPSLAGFALGSLLLGLPFTAITFFALQEVRRVRPLSAPATMGLLTAAYGAGQIAGPPMTAALLARSATPALGFDRALGIAAASLVMGALIYSAMMRLWPREQHARSAS